MADYRTSAEIAEIGHTPQLCQTALVEELRNLFEGEKFNGQEGRKELTVYEQDLPEPEDTDFDADTDAAPAPYLVVQMTGGDINDDNTTQTVDFSIVICCYRDSKSRKGYQDVANIKERMIQHFCARPYFGGMFTILKPITWALQIDETPPYYFGAVTITATAPAMTQDSELEELI